MLATQEPDAVRSGAAPQPCGCECMRDWGAPRDPGSLLRIENGCKYEDGYDELADLRGLHVHAISRLLSLREGRLDGAEERACLTELARAGRRGVLARVDSANKIRKYKVHTERTDLDPHLTTAARPAKTPTARRT